jgi:hypothetical protein
MLRFRAGVQWAVSLVVGGASLMKTYRLCKHALRVDQRNLACGLNGQHLVRDPIEAAAPRSPGQYQVSPAMVQKAQRRCHHDMYILRGNLLAGRHEH